MRTDEGIVVFDGVCNFCSASMRFILDKDVTGRLMFAPMQSPLGRELMIRNGLDPSNPESVLLLKGGVVYLRSDAMLEIAKDFGFWRWLRIFRFVPQRLRDYLYGVVARNRYRLLGRRNVCFVPTEAERKRFLDTPNVPEDGEAIRYEPPMPSRRW